MYLYALHLCMMCFALELLSPGLPAVIVVLPLPLLRPLSGTLCLRNGAVSTLRRSVCDGEACGAVQQQGKHDIFMCGARFERRFQCLVYLTQPHFAAPLSCIALVLAAIQYLLQLLISFLRDYYYPDTDNSAAI